MIAYNPLIPELTVSNIDTSRRFYVDVLGFSIEYERQEDKFLFLSFEGSQLMLEEASQSDLNNIPRPFGSGINFSIGCADVETLYQHLIQQNYPIHKPLVKREFRVGNQIVTDNEFAILDPDGYYFRFSG